MSKVNYDHLVGLFCIIIGIVTIAVVLGDLVFRVIIAFMALSLINYGLRLRGLPPLQLLVPMIISRKRWF